MSAHGGRAASSRDSEDRARVRLRRASVSLALVGALFLVLLNVLMSRQLAFSTDEADYLAKVNPSVPEPESTAANLEAA